MKALLILLGTTLSLSANCMGKMNFETSNVLNQQHNEGCISDIFREEIEFNRFITPGAWDYEIMPRIQDIEGFEQGQFCKPNGDLVKLGNSMISCLGTKIVKFEYWYESGFKILCPSKELAYDLLEDS